MRKKIFINLPIKNLKETVNFFAGLGFTFNPQFTDENATAMIIEDNIFVMLLQEEYFKTFIKKELIDTDKQVGVLIALNLDSKNEVDEMVDKAIKLGGIQASEPFDHGFMYQNSFYDINGHTWEIFWMDENHIEN